MFQGRTRSMQPDLAIVVHVMLQCYVQVDFKEYFWMMIFWPYLESAMLPYIEEYSFLLF